MLRTRKRKQDLDVSNFVRLNSAVFQSFLFADNKVDYCEALKFAASCDNQLDNSKLYGTGNNSDLSVIRAFATMHHSHKAPKQQRLSDHDINELFDIILRTGGAMKLTKENVYHLADNSTPRAVFECFLDHHEIFGLEGALENASWWDFNGSDINSCRIFTKCIQLTCSDANAYQLFNNVTSSSVGSPLWIAIAQNNIYSVQKILERVPLVELDLFVACDRCSFCAKNEQCSFSEWTFVEDAVSSFANLHTANAQVRALAFAAREILEDYRKQRELELQSIMLLPPNLVDIINTYGTRPTKQ